MLPTLHVGQIAVIIALYETIHTLMFCHVSLGLKEFQKGNQYITLNKALIFFRKRVHINMSRRAALKLALMPASRND